MGKRYEVSIPEGEEEEENEEGMKASGIIRHKAAELRRIRLSS